MESDGDTGQDLTDTKPVVLILIGLPGSGKSTFCDGIVRISSRPWVRICQDTINGGKSGTKKQCLSAAAAALNERKSVIIDRCNLERLQRSEFLTLEAEKHAVFLDLPVKLCVSRSVARSGHEGRLQGGRAAAVVNRMARNVELPELSEGFRRITVCRNSKDVEGSIEMYGSLGVKDSLPGGVFGEKKIQLGIAKFLRKPDAETSSRNTVDDEDRRAKRKASHESDDSEKKVKGGGSWNSALYDIAMNPEKHRNAVLEYSDDYVVVNDAYPKAKRHVLVVARVEGLDSIRAVDRERIPLLRELHAIGLKWAKKYVEEDDSLSFRLGYHSTPSMRQLHLHVISQDFDSPHLKNKKHWNSFNTPFFIDSIDAMNRSEEGGNCSSDDGKEFLERELRCHRCKTVLPNLPKLKSHLGSCKAPFPVEANGRLVSAHSENQKR